YDTLGELVATLDGKSGYDAAFVSTGKGKAHSIALGDLVAQDIKSAAHVAQFQASRLEPDEMASSKAWMQTNLTGLPSTWVYVDPCGEEDTNTESYAGAPGYRGAGGA